MNSYKTLNKEETSYILRKTEMPPGIYTADQFIKDFDAICDKLREAEDKLVMLDNMQPYYQYSMFSEILHGIRVYIGKDQFNEYEMDERDAFKNKMKREQTLSKIRHFINNITLEG